MPEVFSLGWLLSSLSVQQKQNHPGPVRSSYHVIVHRVVSALIVQCYYI